MAISLGTLLKRHIKPEHQVLCVGPYTNRWGDPSPLFASLIIGKNKGQLHLLDSQSQTLENAAFTAFRQEKRGTRIEEKLMKLMQLKPATSGAGDLWKQYQDLNQVRKAGAQIKLPKLHFADAMKTGREFEEKQFDVLIDAGSYGWILSRNRRKGENIDKLMDEYSRISRKAIIIGETQSPSEIQIPLSEVAKTLRKQGANVMEIKVKNKYLLTPLESRFDVLDEHLRQGKQLVLEHAYEYDRALVVEFPAHRGG